MKKLIFGIFAHPDDEAFGPAGTLLSEVKNGADLHLITLTNGDAGTNKDAIANLGAHRLTEWQQAGTLLGAKTMHHLGYKDGHLNNIAMIEASERIISIISDVAKNTPADAVIEFITFDLNGLTGHIDHIVAARAACYSFYTLQKTDPRFSRIRLFCLPRSYYPAANTNWLYMEQGRSADEIDEVIDNRHLKNDILAVMRAHHSQRDDAAYHINLLGDNLGVDSFLIKT